jgi:hypothetical protein
VVGLYLCYYVGCGLDWAVLSAIDEATLGFLKPNPCIISYHLHNILLNFIEIKDPKRLR